MKKPLMILLTGLFIFTGVAAGGYQPGDKASDFKLKNIDGKYVSLSDYKSAKAFVIVFTCNHCPYAQAYQDRLIALDKEYKPKGIPVIAINPNDPALSPGDSFEEMKKRAQEKQYTFPYLFDETQSVYKTYGAERTPHIFLLEREGGEFIVRYVGAIDDNYKDASQVKQAYLKDAMEAVLSGKSPDPELTKAIGCSIKTKQL